MNASTNFYTPTPEDLQGDHPNGLTDEQLNDTINDFWVNLWMGDILPESNGRIDPNSLESTAD